MHKPFEELESVIGYSFNNKELLKEALTHSSYANEIRDHSVRDNERLEFFGDAIIEFCVSDFLFGKYKDSPEGYLTKTRAAMVCESGLAVCAKSISLGEYIFMGKGEEHTGGRERPSIISDAFEALVAAIYLDSGVAETDRFIHKYLLESLKDKELFFDAKTRLQEIVQQNPDNELKYEELSEEGPVHDRTFVYGAFLNGLEIGRGSGHSKKEAQQQAALAAIKNRE